MGMIATVLRVTKNELEEYLKDSKKLEDWVYDEKNYESPKLLDLDKAWDGIIFLLTGDSFAGMEHPLVRILFSNELIDDEQDMGYGPAHYLTAEQVKELNTELSVISAESLRKNFDGKKMHEAEVYPFYDPNPGDDEADYLLDNYTALQAFYAEAAKNDEAVISWIS